MIGDHRLEASAASLLSADTRVTKDVPHLIDFDVVALSPFVTSSYLVLDTMLEAGTETGIYTAPPLALVGCPNVELSSVRGDIKWTERLVPLLSRFGCSRTVYNQYQ